MPTYIGNLLVDNAYLGTNTITNIIQNPNYYIGQFVGGGYVFYISGATVLVAYPSDISTTASWGCSGTNVSTGTAIGTGLSNSNNIITACADTTIGAALCLNFVGNEYNDWYLPSKDELNQIYVNRAKIPNLDTAVATSFYMASSQGSNNTTFWAQYFNDGSQFDYRDKASTTNNHVRPIRIIS